MTVLPKPEESGKWEKIRRLRLGEITRLIRHRYGVTIPDDDAGRPDLMELLYLASQAPAGAEKKIRNYIEIYAPWMLPEEVEGIVEHLSIIPHYQKTKTARGLGVALHLTNAEREWLRLWQFKPIDMTDEQLEEQKKEKRRQQDEKRRRRKGVRSREQYRAEMAAKPRPWETENCSRRTYERRCRKVNRNMSQAEPHTIVNKAAADLAALRQVEKQKGHQGRGGAERLREAAEAKQVERCEQRRSRDVAADLATDCVDYRIVGLLRREAQLAKQREKAK